MSDDTTASPRYLVTGGTRGIGKALSLKLAEAGATVTAGYHSNEESADALRAQLGDDHQVIAADVAKDEDVAALVKAAAGPDGRLTGIVHCAGIISHIPLGDLTSSEWHRVLDTNLTSAFLLSREALGVLTNPSSVVFIGSGAAFAGIPSRAHYTASKAGLIGLTRSLAKEFGGQGIRFNVVSSGIVQTERVLPDEVVRTYSQRIPLGRLALPEEVAEAALWLLSDKSSYVNAATLDVNGGM